MHTHTHMHTHIYIYEFMYLSHLLISWLMGIWAGSTFRLLWAVLQSARCVSIPVIRWLRSFCQPPPLYSIYHVTLLLVCSPCNSHLSWKSSSQVFSSAFLPEDVYELICSRVLHINLQGVSISTYHPGWKSWKCFGGRYDLVIQHINTFVSKRSPFQYCLS